MPEPRVRGIHHITCVATEPQPNLDFYAGTLGLRLVKRSVNQDDPSTYHLFYADREGRPGTDITFFPWGHTSRGATGAGQANEVSFAVPEDSLGYWRDRLAGEGVDVEDAGERFGEPRLTFSDPDGLALAIVGTADADERVSTPWERSPVPAEHQLRGFHGVRIAQRHGSPTVQVLEEVLGLEAVDSEGPWTRYRGSDPLAGALDLRVDEEIRRSRPGAGTVHHVAWQAGDTDRMREIRDRAVAHHAGPTDVIDRHWFESVYFREPGGVLFELATDEPGFTVDEPLESLGERLILPPWMEARRAKIEAALAEIELPYPSVDAFEEG